MCLVLLLPIWTIKAFSNHDENESIDFPPQLDADDIRYYSEQYDLEGLYWAASNIFARRKQRWTDHKLSMVDVTPPIVSRGGGSTYTTRYKLAMDLEQVEYLLDNVLAKDLDCTKDDGNAPDYAKRRIPHVAKYLREVVAPTYRKVLETIPPLEQLERTAGLYPFSKADIDHGILDVYNKAHYLTASEFTDESLVDDRGKPITLLNEKLDVDRIQKEWFGEVDDGELSQKGVVVIDDILSPLALERIRNLLLESTVFYQTKMPLRFGGYAGAYIDDGLHDKILLALAFELNQALPRIMKGHPLRYLWAYKYDSEYSGIATHADEAAVNVNIWLTPDEANLDPDSGGLVVFTAKPPPDADFQSYNTDTARLVEELIAPTGYANVTVPYRYNRAVMFDSALFHHTDKFRFKGGYLNRRINLTILYGSMVLSTTETNSGSSEL